jgi:hypothetical protein
LRSLLRGDGEYHCGFVLFTGKHGVVPCSMPVAFIPVIVRIAGMVVTYSLASGTPEKVERKEMLDEIRISRQNSML